MSSITIAPFVTTSEIYEDSNISAALASKYSKLERAVTILSDSDFNTDFNDDFTSL